MPRHSENEPHSHECPVCHNLWSHTPNPLWTDAQNIMAHTCSCGAEQWYWRKGPYISVELNQHQKADRLARDADPSGDSKTMLEQLLGLPHGMLDQSPDDFARIARALRTR